MASLLEEVQSQLGGNEIGQISQQLGVDPTTARNAVNSALPMIVGGMAQHADTPQGATQVQQLAEQHGGLLNNIASAIHATQPADGAGGGLLSHIFGQHQPTVQNGVQQASGLDGNQTRKLLLILTPIVLAVLARRHNQPSSSATAATPQATNTSGGGGLASILRHEATQAAQGSPQLGGILGQIFGGH